MHAIAIHREKPHETVKLFCSALIKARKGVDSRSCHPSSDPGRYRPLALAARLWCMPLPSTNPTTRISKKRNLMKGSNSFLNLLGGATLKGGNRSHLSKINLNYSNNSTQHPLKTGMTHSTISSWGKLRWQKGNTCVLVSSSVALDKQTNKWI